MLDFKKENNVANLIADIEKNNGENIETKIETPVETKIETPVEIEPKKKGRGRPKGSLKFKKEASAETDVKKAPVDDIEKEIEALRNQHNNLEGNQQTIVVDGETIVDKTKANFLSGYLLLIIADVFFPMAISYLFKKQMKAKSKTKEQLKLTEQEKKELTPLADACAKELSLNMSATTTFALAMVFVYASKID